MKYFKVIVSLMTIVCHVWTLSETEEKYFIETFQEFFEEPNEIMTPNKRGTEEDEESAALIATENFGDRENHYWTRKRGRERETTVVYDLVYPAYPPGNVFVQNSYQNRNKRQALKRFLKVDKSSSRMKREAGEEIVQNEGIESNDTKVVNDTVKEKPQEKVQNRTQHGTQGQNIWKQFNRRYPRCCNEEVELPFNDTFLTTKAQCIAANRKMLRKNNDTQGKSEDDSGLSNLFSCDRVNRWKTVVTCTIDCVAQKLGMINSDEIVLDVAKSVVRNNFAAQSWEEKVTDEIVEKCSKDIAKISNSTKIDNFGLQCSLKAAEFAYCVWRELFLICPLDKQQKTKQCDQLRNVLEKTNDKN